MDSNQVLRANKGEWSELYVLFKVLDERVIPAAGSDLQPLAGREYTFLKVLREEKAGELYEYNLESPNKVKIIGPDKTIVKVIDTKNLSSKTKKIFKTIKETHDSSFIINDVKSLMEDYLIHKVKASSTEKTDLLAVIPDNIGTSNNELGFSIKSHIGGAPTLVNSSSHTGFVYEVFDYHGDISTINQISGASKVRKRLQALIESGAKIKFKNLTSSIFHSNLRLADTTFPVLMANMLIDYYSGKGSGWLELSKRISSNRELDVSELEADNIIKNFLRSAALGMVPAKPWNTKLTAYGGYIVVLNDGRLVCYHLLNDDEFRDYLFKNTKLDTPSTTRHKFGQLYTKDNKLMIDLNLQIRFIK